MKIVLTAIALSVATLSGASALNFTSVDDSDSNSVYASQAADANSDGKLTPTEFKNV